MQRTASAPRITARDEEHQYPALEDDDEIADPVVTRPVVLDKVNATLASGHYQVDDFELD